MEAENHVGGRLLYLEVLYEAFPCLPAVVACLEALGWCCFPPNISDSPGVITQYFSVHQHGTYRRLRFKGPARAPRNLRFHVSGQECTLCSCFVRLHKQMNVQKRALIGGLLCSMFGSEQLAGSKFASMACEVCWV